MEQVGPNSRRRQATGAQLPAGDSAHARVFRHRVVLLVDRSGVNWIPAATPLAQSTTKRVQNLAHNAAMARFVWADSRLTEPGHPLSSLLPASPRSSSGLAALAHAPSHRARPGVLRSALPWVAAAAAAGLGFLVFLLRAQ